MTTPEQDTSVATTETLEQSPEQDALETPPPPVADWRVKAEYPSLMARSSAALIDLIVMLMPVSLLFAMLVEGVMGSRNYGEQELMMAQQTFGQDPEVAKQVLGQLFSGAYLQRWLLENLVFTGLIGVLLVWLWYRFSATPGKMLLGMKIVDADTGLPPNNGQNIIRFLGYHVSLLVFGLGVFWVMWDKRRRAWHDMMAGTVVVYKRSLPKSLANATLSTS